jgi:hypothetical protein
VREDGAERINEGTDTVTEYDEDEVMNILRLDQDEDSSA